MKLVKLILLFALMTIAMGGLALSAGGKADNFIIENADGSRTIGLSSSPTLTALINAILTRFTLEFADGSRTQSLEAPSAGLAALANAVAPRVIMEFADGNATRPLAYPGRLISDTTPPQQNNPGVTSGGSGVTFSWQTNEPAKGTVKYGFQPGALNQSVAETLFATQHVLTITGLNPSQTVYYRLVSVDRSGNMAQTNEQIYKVVQGSKIFLPSVIR
jgi:hypothetical protein